MLDGRIPTYNFVGNVVPDSCFPGCVPVGDLVDVPTQLVI